MLAASGNVHIWLQSQLASMHINGRDIMCAGASPARCHDFDSSMLFPSIVTCPLKYLVFPARVSRREVFPAPLGPVIASTCPVRACPETPCKMGLPRTLRGGKASTLVDTDLLINRPVTTKLLRDLVDGRGGAVSASRELPPGASRWRSENSSTWSTTMATSCWRDWAAVREKAALEQNAGNTEILAKRRREHLRSASGS